MVADMEVHTVADMEVDKVASIVVDMASDKKTLVHMEFDIVADKEVNKMADMVAGYGCWLIRPKLFLLEPYPTCVTSKLCKFFLLSQKC